MTTHQHIASHPAHSVWVMASAGTGKTKILTDRVLRLLLAGTPPERILCLTYTRAAAAEMQERIQGRLAAWVGMPDAVLQGELEALQQGSGVRIQGSANYPLPIPPPQAGEGTGCSITPHDPRCLKGEASPPVPSPATRGRDREGVSSHPVIDHRIIAKARRLFAELLESPEGGVRMQTIHAFCQSLLQRFPLEAGIPPHFTILDSRTEQELLQDAWIRTLQSGDAVCQEALTLLTTLSHESRLDATLRELVRSGEVWEQDSGFRIQDPAHDTSLNPESRTLNPEETADLQLLLQLCREGSPTQQAYAEKPARWLANPTSLEACWDTLLTQERTPRILTRLVLKDQDAAHPHLRESLARMQERALRLLEAHATRMLEESTHHLLTLASAMQAHYQNLKAAHGVVDYQDLIRTTRALLRRSDAASWVLYKLDGGLDHLLVDEAQDTSPLQWEVIAALAEEFFAGQGSEFRRERRHCPPLEGPANPLPLGEGRVREIPNADRDTLTPTLSQRERESASPRTLFVVGDDKQSIYSFQGADPEAFHRMRDHYARAIPACGASWQVVELERSFRSTETVLQLVDTVCADPIIRASLSETATPIRHHAHRQGHAGQVELWPLIPVERTPDLPPWHLPVARIPHRSQATELAERIAVQIRTWLDEGEVLASKARPITPGDVLILLRTRHPLAVPLVRALKRHGVPVAGIDRLAVATHIAVEDLLSLTRFLLLPEDDLALAETLRSPLFALSEEALLTLAHGRGKTSLWSRLREMGEEPEFHAAYTRLHALRAQADRMAPYELYAQILEPMGGRQAFAARLGPETHDPLDAFLELALEFERTHAPSLQGFVHWMEADSAEITRDAEQGSDQVRILTVHGAKGLQAPIVFLPDTTSVPKERGAVLWIESDTGKTPLFVTAAAKHAPLLVAEKQRRKEAALQEYHRLLYVALTRAEDRLYVCGMMPHKASQTPHWYAHIQQAMEQLEATEREGVRLLTHPQRVPPVSVSQRLADRATAPLPEWARRAAPFEASPAHPLTPTALAASLPATGSPLMGGARRHAVRRGILIHRILEWLPLLPEPLRAERLHSHLAMQGLSDAEQQAIARSLQDMLHHPDLAPLFAPDALAEAAISGVVEGQVVAGRIDRLVITHDEVRCIDYKTDRRVPRSLADIPPRYLAQMQLYAALLSQLYPSRRLSCFLLFTEAPQLFTIPLDVIPSAWIAA
jgi:ATP-dependent helicase/nuclease subunit A